MRAIASIKSAITWKKHEAEKLNGDLKEKKKRAAELEPFSFYLSAWEEDRHTIAQANVELDDKGRIVGDLVNARKAGNFVLVSRDEVDYIDVSPSSWFRWPHRWCLSSSMTTPIEL